MNPVISIFGIKSSPLKACFAALFLFCSIQFSKSQVNLATDLDTLKAGYKGTGELRNVDLLPSFAMGSFGYAGSNQFLFSPIQLLSQGGNLYRSKEINSMRYTSLPHISFAYAFGSSGFQFTKVQYSQAFNKGLVLNLDFLNNQSSGILRNSGYQDRDILIRIQKKAKSIHSLLSSRFITRNLSWNGGIVADSLPFTYSLGLIPVNKADALSSNKEVQLNWVNHFIVRKDSLWNMGVYLSNSFYSKNRVYTETGDLSTLYSAIYYDSSETRDHVQMSTVENQVGAFYSRGTFKINAGVNQRFWNYRNNQIYRDTLELGLVETMHYKSKNLQFQQAFEYYFLGRSNAWKNLIRGSVDSKKWKFQGDWAIENSLPELFQRHYSANNVYYQLSNYLLQFKNNMSIEANYSFGRHEVQISGAHILLKNPYFFDGQQWRNDLFTSIQLLKFDVSVDFNWKGFSFHPLYSLTFQPTSLNFYPTHLAKARIGLKGGIFKNKKLVSFIGIEPQWVGAFGRMSFLPLLDVFLFNQLTEKQQGFVDLSFYAGFEVKGFRFFARAENIGYFWNNRMIQTVKGYPISPLQIRLGITWDFWN